MKNINRLIVAFFLIGAVFTFGACDEDESGTIEFQQVYSSYDEANGTGTVTIPVRKSGSVSEADVNFIFGGTATEGEDFEFIGLSDEGVQISVIDDDTYEPAETLTIRMEGAVGGNQIYELTILSDCDYDPGDFDTEFWDGEMNALEDYGSGTYGPYHVTLVQSDTNPNRYDFDNFYDSGYDAYIEFDVANGTVKFPDGQTPGGKPLTNSSGTFDQCLGVLTINLNYDGGDWVYRFTR